MLDNYSIRKRLAARLLPLLLVFSIIVYFVIDKYTYKSAEKSYDNLLAASALAIADAVQNETGGLTVEVPYSSHAILAYRMSGRVFYRVNAPDGAAITGYEALSAAHGPARSRKPHFEYGEFLGAPVRIVTLGRFVSGGRTDGWVTVLVAQSTEDRERFAAELRRLAFGPTLVMMVLAGALIWVAIRQSLRPLDDVERAILAGDPHSLKPLDVRIPWEIRHLVGAVNAMISRLRGLLSHMQDFVADSAHQLRSPLADLRTQLELAQQEPDPDTLKTYLGNARRNAMHVSQLANQLLADTMIVHRGEIAKLQPLDLLETVELTIDDFVERTNAKIRFDFASLREVPRISGDPLMLREAITNLLDNAVKYAGAEKPIDVTLTVQDYWSVLDIADRGPGIPSHERKASFGRFFRGEAAGNSIGSGLGLAIVANVMERHGADIELGSREGGGLRVTTKFHNLAPGTDQ